MHSSGCLALYGGLREHSALESFVVGVAWFRGFLAPVVEFCLTLAKAVLSICV